MTVSMVEKRAEKLNGPAGCQRRIAEGSLEKADGRLDGGILKPRQVVGHETQVDFSEEQIMELDALMARTARPAASVVTGGGVRGGVAKCLMVVGFVVGWAAATVAPVVLTPAVAVAQDEEAGEDAESGGSILSFYWTALGPTWTIVFLALSFWLVALVVMCFLQLRKTVLLPPTLSTAFEQHVEQKQYQEAYELAKNDDSYLGHVLAAGMGKLQSGYPAAAQAMEEAQGDEAMKLEHKISYVSLVGALAPLFGLLGTVAGMVAAFMVIASRDTAPKPNELAVGISQALVTTQIGLWIAIPAIAAFAMFKNWLQRLNSDVEEESTRLMSRFQTMAKK